MAIAITAIALIIGMVTIGTTDTMPGIIIGTTDIMPRTIIHTIVIIIIVGTTTPIIAVIRAAMDMATGMAMAMDALAMGTATDIQLLESAFRS